MTTFKEKIERCGAILTGTNKQLSETRYWKRELANIMKIVPGNKEASILKTLEEYKRKYLYDLKLKPDAFKYGVLLDIGSGAIPSALCFDNVGVYCLEPLLDRYMAAGYPLHIYNNRARFIHAPAEAIPLADNSVDVVISVNAIDHVDDIQRTSEEIKRVLKPDGKFRMHVHYHLPTTAEPMYLDTRSFKKLFGWLDNLHIVEGSVSRYKYGHELVNPNEKYVLWSNF